MSDYAQLARDCVRRSEFALDQSRAAPPRLGRAKQIPPSRGKQLPTGRMRRRVTHCGGLRFPPDNGRNDFAQSGLDRMWRIAELAP